MTRMAATEPSPRATLEAGELWAFLARPWQELQRVPPLVWLAPLPAVHVLHAGGQESLWLGDRGRYYHARCNFSGSVDFVCPRGWCYVTDCTFYDLAPSCHNCRSLLALQHGTCDFLGVR